MGTEPVLNTEDVTSPVWRKIKEHCQSRINVLRELNDSASKDSTKTALLRGQIKELKNLMALDKPAPSKEADD